MPMTAITAEGLVRKSLQEIRSELRTAWIGVFGSGIDLSPASPDGHQVDLEANTISDLVEMAQAVYAAYDPATAEGVFLDIIGDYVGINRIGSAYSRVDAVFSGNSGVVIPAGTLIRSPGGSTSFASIQSATVSVSGTAAVRCVAIVIGPVAVDAGTWSMVSTISGTTGVVVNVPGSIGRFQETDAEFRIRRKAYVRSGKATDDSIRSYVLNTVDGVSSVSVKSNRTMVVDSDGRAPKSFEVSVQGGDDAQIATAIWASQPSGIEPFGNYPEKGVAPYPKGYPVTDSSGHPQYVFWTRSEPIFAWFKIAIAEYDEEALPEDYAALIKEAIVEWALTQYSLGTDAIPQRVVIPVYQVPGILFVTVTAAVTETQTAPADSAYTSQRISIDSRHVAQTDTGKIQVTIA